MKKTLLTLSLAFISAGAFSTAMDHSHMDHSQMNHAKMGHGKMIHFWLVNDMCRNGKIHVPKIITEGVILDRKWIKIWEIFKILNTF